MNFKDYLREQTEFHPATEPQDVMKMIYQAAFGAEHLLENMQAAKDFLYGELESVPAADNIPLFEDISEDMCRVNLGAWKAKCLPEDWLFMLFVLSAGGREKGEETFEALMAEADEAVASGWLEFDSSSWEEYKAVYFEEGLRAVHHSDKYREAERPAYRLVERRFVRAAYVLEKAVSMGLLKTDEPHVIAIDGCAASGKSTLAGQLAVIMDAAVVRMDDFFLPQNLRTEERLSQPGGNVHHERFAEEVLPYLKAGGDFTYRRFDCSLMDYSRIPMWVEKSPWIIVEGSYSHHPALGEYADMKVFSHAEPEEQAERILKRNSPEMAEAFRTRWIPMEEAYFDAFDIRKKAHIMV